MTNRDIDQDHQLIRIAFVAISITPILMVAAREIPATMAIIVTLFLMAAAISSASLPPVIRHLWQLLTSPAGGAALALVVLAGLSVLWSPIPERGAAHAIHFGGGLMLAAISVCVLRVIPSRFSGGMLAIGMGVAAFLIIVDLNMDSGVRRQVGLATEDYRLNRAAVALALMLPLATALLLTRRRLLPVILVWGLSMIAIMTSVSSSAQLALLVLIVTLPLAHIAPLLIHRLIGVGAVGSMLLMPILAPMANALIPERIHQAVGYGSLTIRGEIWQETAVFVWDKPFFGWGIEASHVLPHLPEAAGLTQIQKDLLNWGHTHNAPLQLWLELGAVGALLAAFALVGGMRALERLPRNLLPAASSTSAAAYAVACVSHGAWQAWWWGLLALIATAFAASAMKKDETTP